MRSAKSAFRIDDLLEPAAFPHPVATLKLHETHISWVVLTGPFAYKIKKPVRFDFIDTATLDGRRHYCHEELRLNRRLAPQLYVDVLPITQTDRALRVGGDATGTVVEYAVQMRQFDPQQELAELLDRDDVSIGEIEALAGLMGRFHRQAPIAEGTAAGEAVRNFHKAVTDNLEQLARHAGTEHSAAVERLAQWTHSALPQLANLFETRAQAAGIRECHGDLHAANIVRWDGGLLPFDCIDFNPSLRWIDVVNDIGFLVMDLQSHDRADLSHVLLNAYLETTGDYEGLRVLPFCAVYRALVRAKVDAIAAGQTGSPEPRAWTGLRRRLHAAQSWTQRPRPTLILMHGASGSGKSWLSERLVAALPAVRLRSDLERKRIHGSDARTGDGTLHQGIYAPEATRRTYARLVECAQAGLQAGFDIIVDAAFLNADDRALFAQLAARLQVRFAIVSCRADPATLMQRVRARAERGTDPSDADRTVLEAQLRNWQPLSQQELTHAIAIDTRDADVVDTAVSAIKARSFVRA